MITLELEMYVVSSLHPTPEGQNMTYVNYVLVETEFLNDNEC